MHPRQRPKCTSDMITLVATRALRPRRWVDALRLSSTLQDPTIIYQDNHLLVVNKPPGWHSVPNLEPSPKCLLTELKNMKLGGGSQNDFLLPLHRIDQPCSGVLLFGKTSKAATRITNHWKKKLVQKEYLCVVGSDEIEQLQRRSTINLHSEDQWYSLDGRVMPQSSQRSRSVTIRPESQSRSSEGKFVSLDWKVLDTRQSSPSFEMIWVKTKDGSRHVVRAMLAQVGICPIQGDVRYGSTMKPLRDMSVALHAFRLNLDPSLKLGTLAQYSFEAPMPGNWVKYFSINHNTAPWQQQSTHF